MDEIYEQISLIEPIISLDLCGIWLENHPLSSIIVSVHAHIFVSEEYPRVAMSDQVISG